MKLLNCWLFICFSAAHIFVTFYVFTGDYPPKAFCYQAVCRSTCSCSKNLWTQCLTNCLQVGIDNLGAVEDKDELSRFWCQRVIGHRSENHVTVTDSLSDKRIPVNGFLLRII